MQISTNTPNAQHPPKKFFLPSYFPNSQAIQNIAFATGTRITLGAIAQPIETLRSTLIGKPNQTILSQYTPYFRDSFSAGLGRVWRGTALSTARSGWRELAIYGPLQHVLSKHLDNEESHTPFVKAGVLTAANMCFVHPLDTARAIVAAEKQHTLSVGKQGVTTLQKPPNIAVLKKCLSSPKACYRGVVPGGIYSGSVWATMFGISKPIDSFIQKHSGKYKEKWSTKERMASSTIKAGAATFVSAIPNTIKTAAQLKSTLAYNNLPAILACQMTFTLFILIGRSEVISYMDRKNRELSNTENLKTQ